MENRLELHTKLLRNREEVVVNASKVCSYRYGSLKGDYSRNEVHKKPDVHSEKHKMNCTFARVEVEVIGIRVEYCGGRDAEGGRREIASSVIS